MASALKTCERLHEYFSNVISKEVKRIHEEMPEKDSDNLGLEKLQIYEVGDEQPIEYVNFEEYDQAFEQLISDSEEEGSGDEKMDNE